MCDLCRQVMKRWAHDDDVEITEDGYDQMFRQAEKIQHLPGAHSAGTGTTGESEELRRAQ